jgi:dolichyl-phosphate-mannose--protein O-mannosyl transferase
VVLLAAVLRLWNLGAPHTLVFGETLYVKDAWILFNNGYESTWPQEANPPVKAGHTDIFTMDPSFVVHPPLDKWLIALGMNLLSPATREVGGWPQLRSGYSLSCSSCSLPRSCFSPICWP